MKIQRKCTITGCDNKHMAGGLCQRHYNQKHYLEHGYKIVPSEYSIWNNMKQRCSNPNSISYKNYGGRGISVCQRWNDSYKNFIDDVGPRPSKEHSIDRIDNNGNYEPSNVRWATLYEQAQNKRISKNNTSGITGIACSHVHKRWTVTLWRNGKYIIHKGFNNKDNAIAYLQKHKQDI